jgi:hypothetical protein
LHWEDLRLSASVNLMKVLIPRKDPNSPFTQEQLAIAENFVDELITLRVLESVAEGATLVNSYPLFLPQYKLSRTRALVHYVLAGLK